MNGRDAAASLVLALLAGTPTHGTHPSPTLPVAAANDNRRPAGVVRGDTLFLDLDVRMARWYPEAADGEFLEAAIVGEVGRAPQVPAPLIRAHEGTVVVARLTNALADSSVTWRGLTSRPGNDSITLRPGETRTTRFTVGHAGTYVYSTSAGRHNPDLSEREQGVGAFVVDHRGARTDDRVFVMNIWGQQVDPKTYRNALAINGHAWPFTERLEAKQGDTLHWRIVNGTVRDHPNTCTVSFFASSHAAMASAIRPSQRASAKQSSRRTCRPSRRWRWIGSRVARATGSFTVTWPFT